MGTQPRTARQLGSARPSPRRRSLCSNTARATDGFQLRARQGDRNPITPPREHEIPVPPPTGRITPARELGAFEGSIGPRHPFLTQQGPSAGLPTAEHPPRTAAAEKTRSFVEGRGSLAPSGSRAGLPGHPDSFARTELTAQGSQPGRGTTLPRAAVRAQSCSERRLHRESMCVIAG